MKLVPFRQLLLLCALLALALAFTATESHARIAGELIVTHGSGTSTITDLVENPDGTLTIEAYQDGHLSGIGRVTGYFSYVAYIDYNTGTTVIVGSGYLATTKGDRINLAIRILEVGIDYPRPFAGLLTVTGGTGRFAGATGYLETSGLDGESFTDPFQLAGVISTLRLY